MSSLSVVSVSSEEGSIEEVDLAKGWDRMDSIRDRLTSIKEDNNVDDLSKILFAVISCTTLADLLSGVIESQLSTEYDADNYEFEMTCDSVALRGQEVLEQLQVVLHKVEPIAGNFESERESLHEGAVAAHRLSKAISKRRARSRKAMADHEERQRLA
jgi:hypothetical protein